MSSVAFLSASPPRLPFEVASDIKNENSQIARNRAIGQSDKRARKAPQGDANSPEKPQKAPNNSQNQHVTFKKSDANYENHNSLKIRHLQRFSTFFSEIQHFSSLPSLYIASGGGGHKHKPHFRNRARSALLLENRIAKHRDHPIPRG